MGTSNNALAVPQNILGEQDSSTVSLSVIWGSNDDFNANSNDVLINTGTGMTGVVNKFQRILGLKIPESLKEYVTIPNDIKPVVFISHMEHHSNQTSWLETIAEVVIIPPDDEGLFCLNQLQNLLKKYKDRPFKIASITSCSNVTGIQTPYHEVAKIMHKNKGVCFVDFACFAPYYSSCQPSDFP
jgi:selenocysteine lyase/cysteine desulfurase